MSEKEIFIKEIKKKMERIEKMTHEEKIQFHKEEMDKLWDEFYRCKEVCGLC